MYENLKMSSNIPENNVFMNAFQFLNTTMINGVYKFV